MDHESCVHIFDLSNFHTYYEKICRFFFSLRGRAFRDSTISAYGTNPIYSPRIFPSMGDGERVSLLRGNSALKFRAGNPLKSVGCLMGARSQRQRRLPTPYLYLPSPTRAQKDAESETQNALAPACGFRRKYLIPTRWRGRWGDEVGGGGSSPRWVAALFKRSAARERTAAFALPLDVWRLSTWAWTRGHGRCP